MTDVPPRLRLAVTVATITSLTLLTACSEPEDASAVVDDWCERTDTAMTAFQTSGEQECGITLEELVEAPRTT